MRTLADIHEKSRISRNDMISMNGNQLQRPAFPLHVAKKWENGSPPSKSGEKAFPHVPINLNTGQK